MKIKIFSILFSFIGILNSSSQVSFGQPELFNDGWQFTLNMPDDSVFTSTFASLPWRDVSLPHDWSIEEPLSPTLAAATGFLPGGIGYYKKTFEVNDSFPLHFIYFEGVYNRSEVYLNGHKLGERPNGYISFLYDMTPYLKEGKNELFVKVDHSRYADSRWYTGSGIYRDVYLIAANDTHIGQWGVGFETVELNDSGAILKANVDIINPKGQQLEISLTDSKNNIVAKQNTEAKESNEFLFDIKNPDVWSVNNPLLNTLTVSVIDNNGNIVDSNKSKVGIRTVKFSPDSGFYLNGENMKIKGVCLHHDAGTLGAAVPKEVWERRLNNLKEIGVNAIRMSHNPQSPAVYELCDEIGLLVMDEASDEWEFPKRKWIEGWNVGEPSYDGSFDFFEEWIETDVADMVRRDRLHPSIIMWSIGNEVDYPNDPYSHPILDGTEINQPMFGGYDSNAPDAMRIGEIAQRLSKVVRSIDTSRPVTGALAGVVMSNETAYPDAVDIVGYNYTENRYDLDHAQYKDRVIYGSETDASFDAWKAARDRDFIAGQFIWTGTDYLGESRGWPGRGFYTGLLDFGSFTKPRGQFRASLWKDEPFTYIGTYNVPEFELTNRPASNKETQDTPWLSIDANDVWNYNEGEIIRVVCYTNSPYARLLLNGKQVGETKPYDDNTGIIYWDIPFAEGTLVGEGLDQKGNVQSQHTVQSSGRPYALRAFTDDRFRDDGTVGVKHIIVEIVDENNTPVKLADNNITCLIDGNALLLGLENSDNYDTGDFTDNKQRAYQGRLLAYVMKNDENPVIVKFTSPLLQSAEITLN